MDEFKYAVIVLANYRSRTYKFSDLKRAHETFERMREKTGEVWIVKVLDVSPYKEVESDNRGFGQAK